MTSWAFWRPIGELEMQNILMKFDPATGEERPYPSHAAQCREWHGGTAWLFDPWTGRRRDARDVGGDVHGLLIVPAGSPGPDVGTDAPGSPDRNPDTGARADGAGCERRRVCVDAHESRVLRED